jgi:hypothetical protein
MKFLKSVIDIALFTSLIVCGCRILPAEQGDRHQDSRNITLVVLADMVTKANRSGEVVCFVDISPEDILRLKQLCGDHCKICPMEMAVLTEKNIPPSSRIPVVIVHLKDTNQEGTILRVKIGGIHVNQAEAFGSFVESGVMNRYNLKYEGGAWHIVFVENVRAT